MQETMGSRPKVDEKETDLLEYVEVVARGKKLILSVTLAALVLSIALALVLPKKYASTALILPPQQDQGLMGAMLGQMGGGGLAGGGLASLAGSMLGTGTLADQYASILNSEAIKDAIMDRFGLMKEYGVKYRLDMYRKMDKIVEVKAGKKDGIISITAEDKDPKRAAGIANAYVEELGRLVAQMGMSDAAVNRRFYEERLAKARVDLAKSEDALKDFQSKNRVLNVPEQAKVTIEGLAQLKAQLALQEVQLATLRRTYTDSSQEVKNASASIANLRSHIDRMEEGSSAGAVPSMGSVPSLGREYVRLMREFTIQETIVDFLTKQDKIYALTEARDAAPVQVIQKAQVPDKKVKPKRRKIVMGLTFAGFMFSVVLTIGRHYLKNMPDTERERWARLKRAWGSEQGS